MQPLNTNDSTTVWAWQGWPARLNPLTAGHVKAREESGQDEAIAISPADREEAREEAERYFKAVVSV